LEEIKLKLTPEQVKRISALAEKMNVSFIEMARLLLELGLKQMEDDNDEIGKRLF